MAVSLTNGTITATAVEILGAALVRHLRRTDLDAPNQAAPRISAATPAKLAGSITYLCDTLAQALAIDAVYTATATVTLTTGAGHALDGLTHVAIDQIRIDAERATPGRPSKWTVQAEIREV